jgi:putative addiction module component (TIGR02574 family)
MAIAIEELRKLPVAEKLRIIELLWDDIGNSTEPFPIQHWQREEARRRAAEVEANPETTLTREEVWKRVDEGNA